MNDKSQDSQKEIREVWDISGFKKGIIKKITVFGNFDPVINKTYWETSRGRRVSVDRECSSAYTDYEQAVEEAIRRTNTELILIERQYKALENSLKSLKRKRSIEAKIEALAQAVKNK